MLKVGHSASETIGDKPHRQEGNNMDHSSRPLNNGLVLNKSKRAKTIILKTMHNNSLVESFCTCLFFPLNVSIRAYLTLSLLYY